MSELLPCMCGLTPALIDCEGGQAMGFSRCYRAACDCGIEQTTWDGSRAEAIERWNRRTPQPVTPAGGEVEATEDMRSAVRWAPSSCHWSVKLVEFFGPDARNGIDALEREIRDLRTQLAEATHPPAADAAPYAWAVNDDVACTLTLHKLKTEAEVVASTLPAPKLIPLSVMRNYVEPEEAALNQRGGWGMKIAVIYTDATAMMHTGADIERRVAVFDAPPELAEFVRLAELSAYATVSLAIVKEPNSEIAAAPKLAGEEP